jgi:hypothetical protein
MAPIKRGQSAKRNALISPLKNTKLFDGIKFSQNSNE